MPVSKLVRNERLKAAAAMLHNLAAASFVAAGLVPLIVANTPPPGMSPSFGYFDTVRFAIILAIAFIGLGQVLLGWLED
jgi:hypothetical protein